MARPDWIFLQTFQSGQARNIVWEIWNGRRTFVICKQGEGVQINYM